jgi:hypothetical protein
MILLTTTNISVMNARSTGAGERVQRQCGAAYLVLVLIASLLMGGCGGRGAVIAQCRPDYDLCINACADRCDQSEQIGPRAKRRGAHFGFHDESSNTWGNGCASCAEKCLNVAENCKKHLIIPDK